MKIQIEQVTPEDALDALAAAKDELEAAEVELTQVQTRKSEAELGVLRAKNELVNMAIARQVYKAPSLEERFRSSAKRA